MIRYAFDEASVRNSIGPAWLANAQVRTDEFIRMGRYEENAAIWSEVKPVFQEMQHDKCVFCERQFETAEYGRIEFDLEHFRPKSSVKRWPPASARKPAYAFATGEDSPQGYFWLAYNLQNYAASCKVCNSKLKSNYFPIAGPRTTMPGSLAPEQAFLCYPLGTIDADPEKLVSFSATTAIPATKSGARHRRGQVIIDFFRLNARERLHRERAQLITILGNSFDAIARDEADDVDLRWNAALNTPRLPHLNCCRSFKRTWNKDAALGRRIWKACKAYVLSEKGSIPPEI